MINAMKFWVNECDIDGFRCDLAAWVQVDFWKEARPAVETVKPLFWLGEFDELENPEYGKVFDASYSWKWMHLTENFYKNYLPIGVLDDLLRQYAHLGDTSMRAWFTSNHDENSWNGTEYEKYGDIAMALAVFSLTWNGVPLLYSGQEMPVYDKRLAFFDKDPIPWTGQYELHDFYNRLFNLRSWHPALRGGDPSVETHRIATSEDNYVFAFLRKNADREVLVLLNFSRNPVINMDIIDDKINGVFRNVFTNETVDLAANKNLQLYQYLVFEK
jgi:glycosidase